MNEKLIDNMLTQSSVIGLINDQLASIDSTLAPVKLLQKLSNKPGISSETFANSKLEQVVQIAVDLSLELRGFRNSMKNVVDQIEGLSDDFYCPTTPCLATEIKDMKCKIENIVIPEPESTSSLVSEISDLKTKIDNIVTSKPEPLDYSKIDFTTPIAEAVAKTQPQPVSSVSEKQLKQSNEEHLRSNNLIIYNVSYDSVNPVTALEYAKSYFNSCGLPSYYSEQKEIIHAQFLSVSEDKSTCNLRVVMSNPWAVRTLLRDAKKLKTTESKLFRGLSFDFSRTYISKDMTKAEQDKHKQLIIDLKTKIREDDSIRWIIRFGKVQNGGPFIKRS